MNKIKEHFKVYPHNENYLISNRGTVWSLHSMKSIGSISNYGYKNARIGRKWIGIHRLVYMTFVNPVIPEGMEVNHINGRKLNNCLDNLELVTHKENMRHADEVLNAMVRGENHWTWKGYYMIGENKFTTAKEAAAHTGFNEITVRKRCKSGENGYRFIPVSKCHKLTA